MGMLCGIVGHKWGPGQCRCPRCGAVAAVNHPSHSWDHCKCRVCGTTRNEPHDWNGCRCRVCGKKRDPNGFHDEYHSWDGCVCRLCGVKRDPTGKQSEYHDWNGCTCRRCGATRDEGHDWKCGKCLVCGKEFDGAGHRFVNGVCQDCGKVVTKSALFDRFKWSITERMWPKDLMERDPCLHLSLAFAALPPEDADEFLVKIYQLICKAFEDRAGDVVRDTIVPFVNARNLPKLFDAGGSHINERNQHHIDSNLYWVAKHLDRKVILQACEQSGRNPRWKKEFLEKCKVADSELVTECDIGHHDYEFVEKEWSDFSLTADSANSSSEYAVYRCKRCGRIDKRATGRYETST